MNCAFYELCFWITEVPNFSIMPKRYRLSEENTICRQRKIRIGNKEVNNGVMKTYKLTEVYNNTTNLLFDGMKKWSSSASSTKKITNSDKTLASRSQINDACDHFSYYSIFRCYYCDKVGCMTCLKKCETCTHLFCTNCSMEVYHRMSEHWLCFSCM